MRFEIDSFRLNDSYWMIAKKRIGDQLCAGILYIVYWINISKHELLCNYLSMAIHQEPLANWTLTSIGSFCSLGLCFLSSSFYQELNEVGWIWMSNIL